MGTQGSYTIASSQHTGACRFFLVFATLIKSEEMGSPHIHHTETCKQDTSQDYCNDVSQWLTDTLSTLVDKTK